MNSLLVAAGIYLSAKIISFIAGELTAAELEKQKAIDDRMEQMRIYYVNTASSVTHEEIMHNPEIAEKRKSFCDFLNAEALSRDSYFEDLYNEIRESKRNAIAALKKKDIVQTPLRKNSLELLVRQLSEAQEKCFGYRQYLAIYIDELKKSSDTELPSALVMQLPKAYPYVGKIIWLTADQLSEKWITYEIPDVYSVKVNVVDKDVVEEYENDILPIMITGARKKLFYGSIVKGAFKAYELVNTHLGFSATVKELQKNHIVLTYRDKLDLYLSKDNLIKPNRFPPVRSTLTVYPIRWEYDLSSFVSGSGKKGYPVTVSERKEDASSSLSFRTFPICFTQDDLSVFMDFYNKNNLQDYDEEFLIGPVNPEDVLLHKGSLLKLQFGDIPLFYIEVDEHFDRSDILRYYFRFHHLCEPGEKTFSADDIFVPFDVSFSPYFAGTSVEMIQQYMDIDDLDDVAALIWDVFEEFRIQDQIRKDREGMGYFFKWENITSQLISVLEQGDSLLLHVRWIDTQKRNLILAEVTEPNKLTSFISKFARKTDAELKREWKPQFFIKDDQENRFDTTVIDAGRGLRIIGRNVSQIFLGASEWIELFASNRPYAEYQQKTALRQFRIGQVINPMIQAACLNGSNLVSTFISDAEIKPFRNKLLYNNPSQKTSVELAFREKNLFFIQGPPGTGKTTVIRELVDQVLESDKESRVLIVSQANVAVDTALKGLIEKYSNEIVRCGNGNKIQHEFQNLRLQKRCQEYLEQLEQRKNSFENSFYSEWEDTLLNESNEYSPVLCELVIRSHRLIGATCVGLAKRNIGLERTEFDLVIIDEAGKALPAELLIPLIRAKKAVIIGDQKQLPPVINPILYDNERIDLEERAVSENDLFTHSFFERIYDRAPDTSKVMLDTQFRMPTIIGTAISHLFYEDKLKNGVGTENRQPILFDSNLTFINYDGNLSYRETKDEHHQISNEIEAHAVVPLVMSIREANSKCKIAIITPYKGQKRLIGDLLLAAGIRYQLENIYVDTIDAFQGSEAEVVIFCTTRAIVPTLFFKDSRRINVALSRAIQELIIIGRMGYFYKFNRNESCLPELADYIKANGKVIPAKQCQVIQRKVEYHTEDVILLPLAEISLPNCFYTKELDDARIQRIIDEYYSNGDFLKPMEIKRTPTGYQLTSNFEQYRAAMELDLSECLFKVINNANL